MRQKTSKHCKDANIVHDTYISVYCTFTLVVLPYKKKKVLDACFSSSSSSVAYVKNVSTQSLACIHIAIINGNVQRRYVGRGKIVCHFFLSILRYRLERFKLKIGQLFEHETHRTDERVTAIAQTLFFFRNSLFNIASEKAENRTREKVGSNSK